MFLSLGTKPKTFNEQNAVYGINPTDVLLQLPLKLKLHTRFVAIRHDSAFVVYIEDSNRIELIQYLLKCMEAIGRLLCFAFN